MIDHRFHKTGTTTDAFGQTSEVKEFTGASSYAPYATTKCEHDVQGNLIRVTDAQGNVTNMFYDALGRKTAMELARTSASLAAARTMGCAPAAFRLVKTMARKGGPVLSHADDPLAPLRLEV